VRLYDSVALLHVAGCTLFLYYAAHYPALLGLGLAAYMFGLRHAFDADHIAAIDDTVRYLCRTAANRWASAFTYRSVIPRSCSRWPRR